MHPALWPAIIDSASSKTAAELAHVVVPALTSPTVVLARMWLADASGDLVLAASAGAPTGGGNYSRVDGAFAKIARGQGKIGQVAARATPFIVRGLRGDEDWLANPNWVARQGVRTFVSFPMVCKTEVLGVIAVFDRALTSEVAVENLRLLTDYAAARLVDLRDHAVLEARLNALEAQMHEMTSAAATAPSILTRGRLRQLERQSIEAALVRTGGRVFGPAGASVLLGMKPTTLASRMKALGIGSRRTIALR